MFVWDVPLFAVWGTSLGNYFPGMIRVVLPAVVLGSPFSPKLKKCYCCVLHIRIAHKNYTVPSVQCAWSAFWTKPFYSKLHFTVQLHHLTRKINPSHVPMQAGLGVTVLVPHRETGVLLLLCIVVNIKTSLLPLYLFFALMSPCLSVCPSNYLRRPHLPSVLHATIFIKELMLVEDI